MSAQPLSVTVPCNLCGSNRYQILYGAGIAQVNRIVRCTECGLMYASPRKVADHIEIESWPEDPAFDVAVRLPQRFQKEKLQVRDLDRSRRHLNALHPDRGRLLEVGSSAGFTLEAFRADGWSVQGIEPDRNAARHANQVLGIATQSSTLEAAHFPSESFDVVVMLHVIEHVPDPVATLREIWRVLRPGGHLLLETPRYDSLAFRILGRRERSLSCDGHIFFFTVPSLRRAYEMAGFKLDRIDFTGRSLTLDRLVFNLGVMSKSSRFQRLGQAFAKFAHLDKAHVTVNLHDIQRVCLAK